jgi:hypothetical protein
VRNFELRSPSEKGLATKSRKTAGCFEVSAAFTFNFRGRLLRQEMLTKDIVEILSLYFFKLPSVDPIINGAK